MGLIRVGTNGEIFTGQHKAIVPKPLFDRVQLILQGKSLKQTRRHEFAFRRLINCGACQATLIAERQKGFVYYRCHSRACEQKTIREESVDAALASVLQTVCFNKVENRYIRQEVGKHYDDLVELQERHHQALTLQLEQLKSRLSNLTDAYVDGVVDKETYIEKKNRLTVDEQAFKERLARIGSDRSSVVQHVEQILELANNAYLSYKMGIVAEKREMVESVTSNLFVKDKIVSIKLNYPFQLIANRHSGPNGGPQRDTTRTLSALIKEVFKYVLTTDRWTLNRLTAPPIYRSRLDFS
jgi:hypothetical protein